MTVTRTRNKNAMKTGGLARHKTLFNSIFLSEIPIIQQVMTIAVGSNTPVFTLILAFVIRTFHLNFAHILSVR